MIGNLNFIFRFPNGFLTLQSIQKNEYGKTDHSKIFYFLEELHDNFESQLF